MDTGSFSGFDLELRENGIAWFQFNTPGRLNGMTVRVKRDMIEAVTPVSYTHPTLPTILLV